MRTLIYGIYVCISHINMCILMVLYMCYIYIFIRFYFMFILFFCRSGTKSFSPIGHKSCGSLDSLSLSPSLSLALTLALLVLSLYLPLPLHLWHSPPLRAALGKLKHSAKSLALRGRQRQCCHWLWHLCSPLIHECILHGGLLEAGRGEGQGAGGGSDNLTAFTVTRVIIS